MSAFPSVDEQLAVIRRGVEKIVPEEELAARLTKSRESGEPLRIKYGIDPTAADVHLGHSVPLRKLRQFQELGHQAVIIIGNYTAMVGDPSGRDEARTKKLSEEDVEANAHFYLSQVGEVIDIDKAEVHRNGDWFGGMSFADILSLCGKVTIAQLLTRDDFAKRMKAETPIYLHECLYPLMQAWDSVQIRADIELGGTEQLYSFMLARDLQKDAGLPQQIGLMSPILVGTDGKKRMGKSLGNYIGLSEDPFEMMKKFMQLSDDCMATYYELLTDIPMSEIESLLKGHPKEAKVRLAKQIIGEYHDAVSAEASAARWQNEIGGDALPSNIPELPITRAAVNDDGTLPAFVLFKTVGLAPSTSEARRVIGQGGAKLGEEKTPITSHDQPIEVTDGLLLWYGKKKFGRLRVN